ncbi:hypothetical protein JTB14_026951 [Gonioctena quinquepunctata]|nr:hypothetical protein JTB14_026951 [Gonioctena quinquepunctata]
MDHHCKRKFKIVDKHYKRFIRNGKRNSQEEASLPPSSNSSCLEARNVSGSDSSDNKNISSQSELIINEGILNNDEDEHEPNFLFDDHDEFGVEWQIPQHILYKLVQSLIKLSQKMI